MAMWERHTHKLCPKGPSFSSSLLDAVYRSIDETNDHHQNHHRNNAAAQVEEDIQSLRRAIMIEKWMETHATGAPRHFPSNSASSTDSSLFSSSETDSSSPKPPLIKQKTKSRPAQKLYGDSLKKVKEPSSPGGKNKIASFLNSIFSPRNLKTRQCVDEWSSMRKSRSMKDTTTTTSCSMASRSCLSKNASSRGSKSKRSVRFCPVSTVIVDQDFMIRPTVGAQKNMDSFRDLDNVSCASSDLFELENINDIARVEEELPVYETTTLQFHHRQLLM